MSCIFETTTINGMTLPNRLVRSATWEGMCDADGRPTEKLIHLYETLARGGIGLIITGYSFIRPDGKQNPGKMGIHTDEFASEYTAMVHAVHGAGGKICMQLVHAGGQTDTVMAGGQPIAPSAVKAAQYAEMPREMNQDDINAIVTSFANAADRAMRYGFDAVQLHGAHGYLISQFLSPHTNRRTDAYGGAIENRIRFLMEVYRSVRARVGKNYPVMIKLNSSDFLNNGLTPADAIVAAKALNAEGIDAIEVSGGTRASENHTPSRANINTPEREGYHVPLAKKIREAVTCPLMVVGGFRSLPMAEHTLREKTADYIALSRPLIREPDLAARWKNGADHPAHCISCNQCFAPGIKEGGIYCVAEKREQAKKRRDLKQNKETI